jgi:hypothetical protein
VPACRPREVLTLHVDVWMLSHPRRLRVPDIPRGSRPELASRIKATRCDRLLPTGHRVALVKVHGCRVAPQACGAVIKGCS